METILTKTLLDVFLELSFALYSHLLTAEREDLMTSTATGHQGAGQTSHFSGAQMYDSF